MKYRGKSSMAYMFRNFWKLIVVTLPISVFMTFFFNPLGEVQFHTMFFDGQFCSLADGVGDGKAFVDKIFSTFTFMSFGKSWWAGIVGLALYSVTASMMVVKLNRHMRVGQMPWFCLKRTGGLVPFMFVYVASSFLAYEAFLFVAIGLLYCLNGVGNVIVLYAVGVTLIFAVRVVISFLFGQFLLAFPLLHSENYRLNTALAYSVRVMSSHKGVVCMFALGYPLVRLATSALAYLLTPVGLQHLPVFVELLFLNTYIPCLAYKLYHDTIGTTRRDIADSYRYVGR